MTRLPTSTAFSVLAVLLLSRATSAQMDPKVLPPSTPVPVQDSVVFVIDPPTGNLTVYVDSTSGPEDGDKLSSLEIQWLAAEGGFVTENCQNLSGLFDVCSVKKLSKIAPPPDGMGPVLDLGNVLPIGASASDFAVDGSWGVQGSYLRGGTLQKYNDESPYFKDTPEPSAMAMLAIGLLGLMRVRRRRSS